MSAETLTHQQQTTAAQSASTPSRKDSYFSNAKIALIVLVVIGHSWSPLIEESPTVNAVYLTLYDLHMPAFILICGFLSKSFTGRQRQWTRLLTGVVVPYFIFSILYGLLGIWISDEGFDPSIIKPYYLLWFLVTLFVWRATAPIWNVIRFPVVAAILICLGASTMDLSGVFEAGRILQYLPFYVAGLFLRREHFEKLRRPLVRVVGAIASLGILGLALRFGGAIDVEWLYYNKGAQQLGATVPEAISIRLMLLVFAAILIVTFFSFVPDRTLPLSRLGELTMYPFLLHGFVTKSAEFGFHFDDHPFPHTATGAIVVTLAGALLACVLLTKPVRWVTRPLVEPPLNWALRQPTPPPGREGA
ncbi:MAG: acyltransferase family protein [Stackebrandtia sp.]